VIGPAQPGRNPKNVKKDVNLQALAKEFSTIDNKDYLKLPLQRILGKIYFNYIIDCGCFDPSKLFKRKYLFQHFQTIFTSSIHTDRFARQTH
jgi:hypothetical protein